ncbi:MAG TPA: hypothetical protein VD969_15545 [Symbiobacteriaceae bacterium]|nr:hypothetical protein [Symbiobacteriaceae bacterium]
MDVRSLYDRLHRDPQDYPLFERIWQVLTFAPSSKHSDEEEMVSLACDAFDYLQATGQWQTASPTGRTQLTWDGHLLKVTEDDDRNFQYHHTFSVQSALHDDLDDGLEDGLSTPFS